MTKYVCKNCNYRFDVEESSECGFCGMDCIEEEKSAEELIEDVGRLLRG